MNGTEGKYNHEDIAFRVKNKGAVSAAEVAAHILGNREAAFAYMIENNPAALNDVLRHEKGFENLPFAPDKKMLYGQIDLIASKNDPASIQILKDLAAGFKFNPNAGNWTTDPELVENLKTIL